MQKRQVHKKISVLVYREVVSSRFGELLTPPENITPEDASAEEIMSNDTSQEKSTPFDATFEARDPDKNVPGKQDKKAKRARGPIFM